MAGFCRAAVGHEWREEVLSEHIAGTLEARELEECRESLPCKGRVKRKCVSGYNVFSWSSNSSVL